MREAAHHPLTLPSWAPQMTCLSFNLMSQRYKDCEETPQNSSAAGTVTIEGCLLLPLLLLRTATAATTTYYDDDDVDDGN